MLSVTVWIVMVVPELGLKAYWVGEMRLCLVRCVMICLLMSESKTFPRIGRREIGR